MIKTLRPPCDIETKALVSDQSLTILADWLASSCQAVTDQTIGQRLANNHSPRIVGNWLVTTQIFKVEVSQSHSS